MADDHFERAADEMVDAVEQLLASRNFFGMMGDGQHSALKAGRARLRSAITGALNLCSAPPAPAAANVDRLQALRLHLEVVREYVGDQSPSLAARRAAQQAIAHVDRLARSIAGFPSEGE